MKCTGTASFAWTTWLSPTLCECGGSLGAQSGELVRIVTWWDGVAERTDEGDSWKPMEVRSAEKLFLNLSYIFAVFWSEGCVVIGHVARRMTSELV